MDVKIILILENIIISAIWLDITRQIKTCVKRKFTYFSDDIEDWKTRTRNPQRKKSRT